MTRRLRTVAGRRILGAMAMQGVASAAATERFRQRFASCDPCHFRRFQDVWASSIGLGTYLGDSDDATDAQYAQAIETALARGCNVIDTAINYRCQRSERTIGRTLQRLAHEQTITRDELLLCTKGGYLPFDQSVPADPARYLARTVIEPGLAQPDEIVAGCHCLAPSYLAHALRTSLANLRVSSVDVYYLHNPEQQLDEVPLTVLHERLRQAFELLERCATDGILRNYGIATWQGLRANPRATEYVALEPLVRLAESIAGPAHHFRAIQLPYNLAMPEAAAFTNQSVDGEPLTPLAAAERLGLSVAISASLLQQRLARLPAGLDRYLPGPCTDAQRALNLVRSTPGVCTALVGMKQRAHVEENLALAQQPPYTAQQVTQLFDRSLR